jgi:hypothetical protein
MTAPYCKKLIEIALPLPESNDASGYDKMPGIGPHPKGIRHWWAGLADSFPDKQMAIAWHNANRNPANKPPPSPGILPSRD